jgi:probable F420-dependent oxidoreductase
MTEVASPQPDTWNKAMPKIKFGLFSLTGDFNQAVQSAIDAEKAGFVSFSPNDHFFSPFGAPSDPQLECFTLLATVAAKTTLIRLVPAVVAASFRPPPLLAKMATALDIASGDRLTLGLGSGWLPTEYHAHGYAFPSTSERLAQLGEAIEIIKAMWTDERPTFTGKYFAIDGAYNQPRPLQQPHPPLMLGGSGTKLLRLAAKHADLVNLIPPTGNGKDFPNDPEATRRFTQAVLHERIALLRGFASEAGRDPDSIELSGLTLICLSEKADDPVLHECATSLGFGNVAEAIQAPVILIGTPQQVCEQLRRQSTDSGVHYFIVAPTSPESLALFQAQVMSEF